MPNIKEDGGDAPSLPASLDINPLKLFDIAKSEGRPLFAAAPMVRYGKLAFRETVAQYGVDLCWTPMILAKEFNRSLLARQSDFTISPESPPTICQFGANSPLELSRATSLIAPYVNGIDINCGCPQSWACAESLGAALMNKRELVASMVKAAKNALESQGYDSQKTISVKIRVHSDLRHTIDFIRTVTDAGASFITIHGRTRSTPSSNPVNLDAIKLLRSHTPLPVLSNGDVFTLSDALRHAEDTGVDGVMAARGLLLNPALFDRSRGAGYELGEREGEGCTWDVVETFMNKVSREPIPFKLVVHHLGEMCGSDRGQRGKGALLNKEERARLVGCNSFLEVMDLLDEVREDQGGLRRL
ncbi:FMN-linked oxidoreductase [Venustampulla echinocandica]|uniref:tRNA-dihydrouridine(20a/20b) synthase [NAD(P)+] n=1 Tax=Venustampulla echinocandica TaxID=2656787 RepID=A0A370U329_9HELO|nr:FMN-linked oxidoreductase [Venustampulla echinocandica]RDL42176.1 FMN-linked oxidoreductase [Venustampulla echinocandica]